MRRALAILALPPLVACGGGEMVKTLPSGHAFRILRGGQVLFADGSKAAMIVFESERRPDDQKGIQADATELWNAYRPEIEKTGLRTAIIQANQPKHVLLLQKGGVITGFTWEKQADGSWVMKKINRG
ncbi:MAG TPA: hypothetical protein VFF76_00640 [Holophagaceae bacterium]|jgi:hypothetical protein|nr:hypothetical protein [Holophagaceae bacterium]